MKINSPLYIITAKSGKGKKYQLNLNQFRNWHFRTCNSVKQCYCEAQKSILSDVKLKTPISIHFTLFKSSNRKIDRSNILSIVEKFFCDALVVYGCIPDDNDAYILQTSYSTGGVDKNNGRVEIEITENP